MSKEKCLNDGEGRLGNEGFDGVSELGIPDQGFGVFDGSCLRDGVGRLGIRVFIEFFN